MAQAPPTDGVVATSLLLHQRSLTIAVGDSERTAEALLKGVRKLGGELESRADQRLVFTIPEPRFRELFELCARLGDIRSQTASAVDASLEAADLEAALRAARERRASLEDLLRRSPGVEQSLLVERRLAEVEQKASAARTQLSTLKRRAAAVRVEISLIAQPVEPLPAVELPFPWLRTLSESELMNPSAPAEDSAAGAIVKNFDVALELEGRVLRDRPAPGEDSQGAAGVLRMRGARTDPVGFAAGFDIKLGPAKGLIYELRGLGGLSTAIGSVLTLGLIGGAGVSGWTGDRVPSSLELPVELFTLLDFGDALRLTLFAQPRWTVTRDARREGAEHGLVADELALGGALLIPQILGQRGIDDGGLRVGFEYTELLSTQMYSVTVGIGFGMATRR